MTCSVQPGQASVEHPAGFHKYPFFLALQPTLPSSFEGRRGYVRYFCRATIDRPWKFDEHTKRAFTVIHHLDLNFISNAAVSGCYFQNVTNVDLNVLTCL